MTSSELLGVLREIRAAVILSMVREFAEVESGTINKIADDAAEAARRELHKFIT